MGDAMPKVQRGFTLIEALVTVSILAIVLTLAAPSFTDWIMIQRVKASATELASDMRFAKGEATKRNVRVEMTFQSIAGNQTCYTIHTHYYDFFSNPRTCMCSQGEGNACDANNNPANPDVVDGLVELKTVGAPASRNVTLTANRRMTFMPPNGFALPNAQAFQVDIDGQNSRTLRVVSNPAGRAQICAPSGSRIVGFPACS